ncbi:MULTISPECIES: hypothetical protein [unclassified Microcoleus]|uniref:hypothetical protein n=1 Tax=unclassified Microcoleus TaxID=2642155 RepID=UPI002FD66324
MILKLVAVRRSQQPIPRRFNIIIYTEYDSAIAFSKVPRSELNRALINIINNACYGVFEKPKNGQKNPDRSTVNFTFKNYVKMQKLAKAVELGLRENGIKIPL